MIRAGDDLWEATERVRSVRPGTRFIELPEYKFALFEIAPELIKQPSDLLRVLLRRHHRGRKVPESLDRRFIEILRQRGVFAEWPLERIVSDREAFLLFLQERWPVFLDRRAADSGQKTGEPHLDYHFQLDGPRDIPFEHDDVRVYVDDLFVATADLNQARYDILQAYPWYSGTPYSRPGFATSFDSESYFDGWHTMYMLVTFSDGTDQEYGLRSIYIDNDINQFA